MRKTFVLDTNVLLQSPNALLSFDDNKVVLTEAVLEEIDNFKKGHSELNVNARAVARFLDQLREKGKLTEGVEMENGGILKVEANHRNVELPTSWDQNKADNRILQVCKALKDQGEEVYLITKDILERIKADIMEVTAQDFESERAPKIDEQYKGRRSVYVTDDDIDKFYKNKSLDLKSVDLFEYDDNGKSIKVNDELNPNEFLVMMSPYNSKKTALARVNAAKTEIVKLQHEKYHPFGVIPKNVGQIFMIEALMAPVNEIPIVIIRGIAGSAKTFMSVACGLANVIDEHTYRKLLVCRPAVTMGEEIGFLPGDEKEKLGPFMRSIKDNLEVLVDSNSSERYKNEDALNGKIQYLFDKGYIDTQAIAFLRGRSISGQYIILDESQNCSANQIKGIVTRCGEGTKIVILGDVTQIDNIFLDSRTSGLAYVAEKMKGSPLCAQVTIEEEECVRSQLVMDAIARLN